MTALTHDRAHPPAERSLLRAVAVPSEHGGWGLTLEPVVLGLAVAPSVAGACLGVAAVLVFLARTPLKVLLVDGYRGRRLQRTRLAAKVLAGEAILLAGLVVAATLRGDPRFWLAVAAAAPPALVGLWFDMRSRSRRLLPELAGSAGVCTAAAAIVLAAGKQPGLAAAVALVLVGRAVSSIPFVRGQIARLHGRPSRRRGTVVADGAAIAVAVLAAAFDRSVVPGAVAVVAVVVAQRVSAISPVPRPAVLGARQMALGLGVVLATALGVLAP